MFVNHSSDEYSPEIVVISSLCKKRSEYKSINIRIWVSYRGKKETGSVVWNNKESLQNNLI